MTSDHVGNLNDRVDFGLGEDTLATRTLDIEGKDAKRSDAGPVAFSGVRDEVVVPVYAESARGLQGRAGNGARTGIRARIGSSRLATSSAPTDQASARASSCRGSGQIASVSEVLS